MRIGHHIHPIIIIFILCSNHKTQPGCEPPDSCGGGVVGGHLDVDHNHPGGPLLHLQGEEGAGGEEGQGEGYPQEEVFCQHQGAKVNRIVTSM